MDEEPQWKKLKLSLERPYKDDNGEKIPVLFDITPEGEHIYEPKESPSKRLGENIRRIFVERGVDFFDRNGGHILEDGRLLAGEPARVEETASKDATEDEESKTRDSNKPMTSEELMKLRMEIMPQLFVALGEMNQARDLLSTILPTPSSSSSASNITSMVNGKAPQAPPSNMSATIVSKPPPIISVQAFNSQLSIGGKDEALRKASEVFRQAAESMERGREHSERYWLEALKIRRGNWGLIPAPLPFGSATGKGADKTSKDFLVTYGLEEAPPVFRKLATGYMASINDENDGLVFPHRQNTRFRVSVSSTDAARGRVSARNRSTTCSKESLEDSLREAQREVVEREIFHSLVKEAGKLPTISAKVSERLIVIDAAQDTELVFELEDADSDSGKSKLSEEDSVLQAKCDFIYFSLQALLLRLHDFYKSRRISTATAPTTPQVQPQPPPLLQPIIDLLQYEVFSRRIKTEVDTIVTALTQAGIPSQFRFQPVGDLGEDLVKFLVDGASRTVGGEAVLRIDSRHMIRLTLVSPSTLTAHLSQATLGIASITQLRQLLVDEVKTFLLQRLCELGQQTCESVEGMWFVDLDRCVGRWDGCVIDFRVACKEGSIITCRSFVLLDRMPKQGKSEVYTTDSADPGSPLLSWASNIIQDAIQSR